MPGALAEGERGVERQVYGDEQPQSIEQDLYGAIMARLPIADAHIHLWDLERNRYPWLQAGRPRGPFGERGDLAKTYRLEDYLADAARQNVTRIVHIEAGWDPADP